MGDMFSLTSWKNGLKKINPLKQVFLLFIIFASVQPIFAHSEIEEITVANSTHPVLIENQNPTYNPEEILRESQRNVDRSISILGIVATLMGVLVGLLTLIIMVAVACGVLEYRRWRLLRKEVEEEARVIKSIRNKAEEDLSELREGIKNQILPITEKPSAETKEKLDEFSRKSEPFEQLGFSLKPEDYHFRGLDSYYKGKYNKALALIEKAIDLKPDYATAWDNKGVALTKLGRHEDALTAYEKAIDLKPDYADAWYNKGVTLGELGRHDEVLTAHEKAVELNPDDAGAWFNKACTYSLKGDKENALTNLSKAIDLDAKLKEKAKKDEDFKELWDDPDFKKIVSNQK